MGQVRHESQDRVIEKLDPNKVGSIETIIEKINELIEVFAYHYHVTSDTRFNTTFPRVHEQEQQAQTNEQREV